MKTTTLKVEFEVDKNEIAVEAYRRIVEDMAEGFLIKKSPPLFPKIIEGEDPKKKIEQNKKEWEDFEESLDTYRKVLMMAFKKVKILKIKK